MGEQQDGKYSKSSGDEQHDGADGSNYFSTGNGRTTAGGTMIVPKVGMKADIEGAIDNHADVTMTFFLNGHTQKSDGRILTADFETDSKTGMLKCAYTFAGGPAQNV